MIAFHPSVFINLETSSLVVCQCICAQQLTNSTSENIAAGVLNRSNVGSASLQRTALLQPFISMIFHIFTQRILQLFQARLDICIVCVYSLNPSILCISVIKAKLISVSRTDDVSRMR